MSRSYKPGRIIRSGGVHTFYIGKPEDPITQCFEAYCLMSKQTFSESCRDMIVFCLVKNGWIKDPGVDLGTFLKAGEGELTPAYYAYRDKAEEKRTEQLIELSQKKERPPRAKRGAPKEDGQSPQSEAKYEENPFD